MTEEPHVRSLDAVVAVLQERIENIRRDIHDRFDAQRIHASEFEEKVDTNHRELADRMSDLEAREKERNFYDKERNGNVEKLFKRQERAGSRLDLIEGEKHEAATAKKERERIYQSQWKMLSGGMGIGASAIGAVLYLLGML